MQVVGLDEIESFLRTCSDAQTCEALNAFVFELVHRRWENANALLNDYPQAEIYEPPKVRFRLASKTILIEAAVHFDSGVLLLMNCTERRNKHPDSGDRTEWEAA